MASVPPPSAADSANPTPQSPKKQVEVQGATNNEVFNEDEQKPDIADDGLDHLDSTQCIERFRKYESEYSQRLLAKYFSGKSLSGGNIFEEEITIDGEIIKSSRLPCFWSYIDPVVGVEEPCSNGSSSPADNQASTPPNGKNMAKKN